MTKSGAALLLALALFGCRQDMHDQPRYRPLEASPFFPDRRSARPLPAGTVARGHLKTDRLYYTGRRPPVSGVVPAAAQQVSSPGAPPAFSPDLAEQFPSEVTMATLVRGREAYNNFCTPCHAWTGYGTGMIVQRGFSPPPSFHTERLRAAPVGHFFDVITNGYGAMYSYASRIAVPDRWAIIAYIRALQLSQNMPVTAIPPDLRSRLAPPELPAAIGTGQITPTAPPPYERRPERAIPEGELR